MSPRIKKTIRSGIYRRDVVEAERSVDPSPEAFQAWLERFHAYPAEHFAEVLRIAREVLSKHGVEWCEGGQSPRFRNAKGGQSIEPFPEGPEPEIVRDAAGIIKRLAHFRDFSPPMVEVFNAGRLFERMGVRAFEPLAERGRKGASGQAKRAKAIQSKTAKRKAKMKAFWLRAKQDNPKAKVGELDQKVVDMLKDEDDQAERVDVRTVANARRKKWR